MGHSDRLMTLWMAAILTTHAVHEITHRMAGVFGSGRVCVSKKTVKDHVVFNEFSSDELQKKKGGWAGRYVMNKTWVFVEILLQCKI